MTAAPFDHEFASNIYDARYKHPQDGDWFGTSRRVVGSVVPALYHAPGARAHVTEIETLQDSLYDLMADRRFCPGGRYLYASGRDLHQVNNCLLLRAEDTREGWSSLSYKAEMALMTGAGIGVWYGDLRAAGSAIARTGGEASGPLGKMMMVNDMGRYVMQGGARRSAIWAGLPWWHADVFAFITSKDWPEWLRERKDADWTVPAPMDTTNISVTLDDDFFAAYHGNDRPIIESTRRRQRESGRPLDDLDGLTAPDGSTWCEWATMTYDTALAHMLRHGEPGFTVDTGERGDEVLRNACTEITSADDSDVCNLGSLVLPRFHTPDQFGAAVRDAVAFLTAGTLYSHVPYTGADVPRGSLGVDDVRNMNRRLGLGLIGVHEFLMKAGVKYGTDDAFEVLDPYMAEYGRALEYAHDFQDKMKLSHSKGATAIAPNGTIGIVMESTPSADPMFSAAEQREVKMANVHGPDRFQRHIVVDPVAKRLVAEGVDPSLIEDAHTLSLMPERRLAQQEYLQRFVDHSISSTVNLPEVVTNPRDLADMGDTLMEYLPNLRGITFYPDGARAGQPRTPVDLEWALSNEGTILAADDETCVGGVCGV